MFRTYQCLLRRKNYLKPSRKGEILRLNTKWMINLVCTNDCYLLLFNFNLINFFGFSSRFFLAFLPPTKNLTTYFWSGGMIFTQYMIRKLTFPLIDTISLQSTIITDKQFSSLRNKCKICCIFNFLKSMWGNLLPTPCGTLWTVTVEY